MMSTSRSRAQAAPTSAKSRRAPPRWISADTAMSLSRPVKKRRSKSAGRATSTCAAIPSGWKPRSADRAASTGLPRAVDLDKTGGRDYVPPMSANLKIGDVTIPGRVLTAPMTGVSDLPFRRIASRCGAAYVATEMVACDSFARGRPDVVRRAAIGDGLPLMVIQLVGRTPEWIAKGAKLAEEAGADIIDFNMGCPAKEVTGALSGSALMREPDLAARLIEAAVNATTRPVTLKMRLGWDDKSRNAPEIAALAERLG